MVAGHFGNLSFMGNPAGGWSLAGNNCIIITIRFDSLFLGTNASFLKPRGD
jgi:hypothetical protein